MAFVIKLAPYLLLIFGKKLGFLGFKVANLDLYILQLERMIAEWLMFEILLLTRGKSLS